MSCEARGQALLRVAAGPPARDRSRHGPASSHAKGVGLRRILPSMLVRLPGASLLQGGQRCRAGQREGFHVSDSTKQRLVWGGKTVRLPGAGLLQAGVGAAEQDEQGGGDNGVALRALLAARLRGTNASCGLTPCVRRRHHRSHAGDFRLYRARPLLRNTPTRSRHTCITQLSWAGSEARRSLPLPVALPVPPPSPLVCPLRSACMPAHPKSRRRAPHSRTGRAARRKSSGSGARCGGGRPRRWHAPAAGLCLGRNVCIYVARAQVNLSPAQRFTCVCLALPKHITRRRLPSSPLSSAGARLHSSPCPACCPMPHLPAPRAGLSCLGAGPAQTRACRTCKSSQRWRV